MENKMSRADRAAEIFLKDYNCAQAVAGAFSDLIGMDTDALLRLAAPFGGGFARTRHLCGAVAGMGLVLGLVLGIDAEDKAAWYGETRTVTDPFLEKFGSLDCGVLLEKVAGITATSVPDARTAEYYRQRPCLHYVRAAAEFTEEKLRAAGRLTEEN